MSFDVLNVDLFLGRSWAFCKPIFEDVGSESSVLSSNLRTLNVRKLHTRALETKFEDAQHGSSIWCQNVKKLHARAQSVRMLLRELKQW